MNSSKIAGTLFALALLLVANHAAALPITITLDIDTEIIGSAGALGAWDLSGPTSASDYWFNDYYTTFEILPGAYTFAIGGVQAGFGAGRTTWVLNIGSETIAGYSNTFLGFDVFKNHVDFAAAGPTAIVEPSALWLMGLGLLALGMIRRRRRRP